jgi:hypothetical protein
VADLKVDTGLLRASAAHLGSVATACHEVVDGHLRLHEVVFAAGNEAAAQGLDSFMCAWTYGVRCIASHADSVGHELMTAATVYESVEDLLLTSSGGTGPAPPTAPVPSPIAFEEPLRVAPRYTAGPVAVQLSAATHVSQLIPGDPDQVALAARQLTRFAGDLGDIRRNLMGISMGTWQSPTASMVLADLKDLAGRMLTAEAAFADAASGLADYARIHADARFDAARALALWQSAKPASDIAHGATVGAVPVDAPTDPDAVLVRAAALAHDAQDRLATAGRALANVLKEAEKGHPQHPGLLSNLRRAVRSFGLGLSTSATGPVEFAVLATELGKHLLDVEQMVEHPAAYWHTWEALGAGIAHAVCTRRTSASP